jgi:hypothetical protein
VADRSQRGTRVGAQLVDSVCDGGGRRGHETVWVRST